MEKFWSYVDQTGTCWLWTGTSGSRYGTFWRKPGEGTRYAHRIAYEALVGPIPDGLTLDHLCRNKKCVNPAHLEPVTQAENARRNRGIPQWRPMSVASGRQVS